MGVITPMIPKFVYSQYNNIGNFFKVRLTFDCYVCYDNSFSKIQGYRSSNVMNLVCIDKGI